LGRRQVDVGRVPGLIELVGLAFLVEALQCLGAESLARTVVQE